MGTREKDRDLERLVPLPVGSLSISENGCSKSSFPSDSVSAASLSHHSGKEVIIPPPFPIQCMHGGWRGVVVLGIISLSSYTGLGFITSITFIFLVGVFMSSWLGASLLGLGEWLIRKMPIMSYIYAASKQISAAISPDENSHAFKEVAIVRHPRIGEYAFGFITSTVILRKNSGAEELCCVYLPTNHLYLGDIFLINSKDIMRPNLSVREGIEIVISGGMSIPKILTIVDAPSLLSPRVGKFAIPQL
ncbi:unnamed protein product [Fraxinus pennsylvanica]|uniref:Protein LIKE COV 3 n=1 Tax=Fraxinus pennsylvanica TaxID=56036 RepID=A0AAD1Z5I1_9LAMI|nr:unnamed protein product [Fraxinus pennsylvanica]